MFSIVLNYSAPALFSIFVCLWLYSIIIKDVSFIDAFWSIGFLIAAIAYFIALGKPDIQAYTIMSMLALWSLRLGSHLWLRWRHEGPDKRYIKIIGDRTGFNRHLFTLWFVFGLQGVLILIIVTPILQTLATNADELYAVSYVGIILFSIGLYFETIGDYQLKKFKQNPNNKGKTLNTGLWRYTRHPNYFGDACVWWGLWLISADISTIYAPLLMTFILVKWSGKPLLEKGLKQSKPDYEDYINSTSGFFPLPPKKK